MSFSMIKNMTYYYIVTEDKSVYTIISGGKYLNWPLYYAEKVEKRPSKLVLLGFMDRKINVNVEYLLENRNKCMDMRMCLVPESGRGGFISYVIELGRAGVSYKDVAKGPVSSDKKINAKLDTIITQKVEFIAYSRDELKSYQDKQG